MATILPSTKNFATTGPLRDEALQRLSEWIAEKLKQEFESNRLLERRRLASVLIEKVESLVLGELNAAGYSFGRIDYSGDINYEKSCQTFSNGARMGTGILLEFHGFACEVSWRDEVDDEHLSRPTPGR